MDLRPPISIEDHIQGNTSAPIELVEYGDYQCPYCGAAYPIVKEIQEQMGDQLKFIFRNFPLSKIHPHARQAAIASEAAGRQGRYWEMHDMLFENQNRLNPASLSHYAQKLSLDNTQFSTDLVDPMLEAKVKKDFYSGMRSGVDKTPTFFINGKKHMGSWQEGDLLNVLDAISKKKMISHVNSIRSITVKKSQMKKTFQRLALSMLLLSTSLYAMAQKPSTELLTPTNHALVLIDHEGQMAFAIKNIDIEELRNNTAIVAGASKIFNVPTVITTVAAKTFSGPVFPELLEIYPKQTSTYLDRTTMNAWEDAPAYKAIVGKQKKKVVMTGLWTSVCIVGPVLSAISDGYDVYIITDACGDVSQEAHDMSIQRMIQAGAKPMTSVQYLLELQRDWARSETYTAVNDLIVKYAGAYGLGVQYARDMLKH